MNKVYVVQEPLRKNRDTGTLEPFIDFTPASAYGEIELLLDRSAPLALTPAPMIHQLKKRLAEFSDEDYLVLVGDTAVIAAAVMVASVVHGKNKTIGVVNVLKWNRQTRQYIKIKLEV